MALEGLAQGFSPVGLGAAPGGRIIVAGVVRQADSGSGEFMAVRLLSDGSLDPAYGAGGAARVRVQSGVGSAAFAVLPDGSLVFGAGEFSADGVVFARLAADGGLDDDFGGGGFARFNLDYGPGFSYYRDSVAGVAALPDGRIFAVGISRFESINPRLASIRLTRAGDPDLSYGSGGIEIGLPGNGGQLIPDSPGGMAERPDGDVIVSSGRLVTKADGRPSTYLARVRPAGRAPELLSSKLGTFWGDVALLRDGRAAIASGPALGPAPSRFRLAVTDRRLRAVELRTLGGRYGYSSAVAGDQHGGLVLAGRATNREGTRGDLGLARLRPGDLRLDKSFGRGGWVTTDLGGDDYIVDALVDREGNIVVLATQRQSGSVLVRFRGDRDNIKPRIVLRGVQRTSCSRRRPVILVKDSSGLERVVVRLDGRAIKRTHRARIRLALNNTRAGRHTLQVRATDLPGNRSRRQLEFRICT